MRYIGSDVPNIYSSVAGLIASRPCRGFVAFSLSRAKLCLARASVGGKRWYMLGVLGRVDVTVVCFRAGATFIFSSFVQ